MVRCAEVGRVFTRPLQACKLSFFTIFPVFSANHVCLFVHTVPNRASPPAVLSTLQRVRLERMLHAKKSGTQDLVAAMTVAPQSKLATARGLDAETPLTRLREELDNRMYDA